MNSIFPRIVAILLLVISCIVTVTCASRSKMSAQDADRQRALIARQNFVYVAEAVPGIVIDLPYTRHQNVTGKPLYHPDFPCLLHRDAAAKLLVAQRWLEAQGFGLKIWDGWRPPSSHMALWYSNPDPEYVTPPENGLSFHTFGVSVDVTLVDSLGRELTMPSGFDEFSRRAWSIYLGNDPTIRRHIDLLQAAMKHAGFQGIQSEWWHYDAPGCVGARPVLADEFAIALPVPKVRLKVKTAP